MGPWYGITLLLLALPSVLSNPYQEEVQQSFEEQASQSFQVQQSFEEQGPLLYPYGPAHGDVETEKKDDGASEKIQMSHSITFFGKRYRHCYVNNNGAISLDKQISTYTPNGFPIEGMNMMCPFWADVDIEDIPKDMTHNPSIYWRQTNKNETLHSISNDLNSMFESTESHVSIKAIWAFIATWHRVPYHGSESNKTNTFQCVIASDKMERCYVMFNYDDINWTTGTASEGDALTGLGGIPAQAGFNTEENYFNMPMSRTEHIINIKSTTNCGIPGRWVFRVDDFMAPGGCLHKDTFLYHGQTIWSDETCGTKCVCKHSGKVHCEDHKCGENEVCMRSGRHYMCQIDEEDC